MRQIFFLLLIILSSPVFAATNVCIDQQGKKSFSEVACEKQGLKSAVSDFPVAVAPVYVVTTEDLSKIDPVANADTYRKIELRNTRSVYGSLSGLAWFLIALMPIAACLFLSFYLLMYIKKRISKYVHVRSTMDKKNS
jgi:hypothetical protein